MTTDEALAVLPNPERYRLETINDGLDGEAVRTLGAMLIDTIGEDHFFGAIYAYLPEGSRQLSIHLRRKLHSLDAAERSALRDCEAERGLNDSECRLLGRIVPEDWNEASAITLSHEALYALVQSAPEIEGPKFFARSRETTAWAMWGGENTRQSALDECNETVEAAGFERDCDIVIADVP